MTHRLDRRSFLKLALGATAAAPALPSMLAASENILPKRLLGKTGQRVSLFGLGGSSAKTPLSNAGHEESMAIIQKALELGVNYFDTAATYNTSEEYLGEALDGKRSQVFLASKTDLRDRDGAWRELEESLKKLRTDYLDLWQMHRVSLHQRDTVPGFAPDGCIKAIEEALDQRVIRAAGISGHHDPTVMVEWLKRFPFQTVLASVNACDVHQEKSFIKLLLPEAARLGVAVMAMKVPAYGRLLNPGEGVTITDAIHYSLSQQGVINCVIGVDSVEMLEENVAAARTYRRPLSRERQTELEQATAGYWNEAKAGFYRSWT